MTTYDTGLGYIQMGIAPANPNNTIGEMRYQSNSALYSPLPENEDSSHAIPPWGNIYDPNDPNNDNPAVVPVDPTPNPPKGPAASNTTKIIIIASASVFFLITVITAIVCCKKKVGQSGNTDYKNNLYEDEETLDMDEKEVRKSGLI